MARILIKDLQAEIEQLREREEYWKNAFYKEEKESGKLINVNRELKQDIVYIKNEIMNAGFEFKDAIDEKRTAREMEIVNTHKVLVINPAPLKNLKRVLFNETKVGGRYE